MDKKLLHLLLKNAAAYSIKHRIDVARAISAPSMSRCMQVHYELF